MKIIKNNQEDDKLWQFNFFQREKLQVRLHTWQGECVSSKIVTGKRHQVGTVDQIARLIEGVIFSSYFI